jgi:predicted SAM-dependent methyltransferase
MNTRTSDRLPPSNPYGIRRVQVGCGPANIFPDWWNVDIRGFDGIDEAMDVTQPWPWTNLLDYVYGEHFLEHLTPVSGAAFLSQANNALRIGGKIRLSTPSLEWVLKTHFNFEETSPHRRLSDTWAINRAFHGWGHQFLFSKEMLTFIIECSGFQKINFFDYGSSNDSALSNLERHGGWRVEHGYPSVWIVEAEKGVGSSVDSPVFVLQAQENFVRFVDSGH